MVDRTIFADSRMLVLDQHALAHLAPEHHEEYLALRGAHRRPGVSTSDPPGPPADGEHLAAAGRPGEWDPKERLADASRLLPGYLLSLQDVAVAELHRIGVDNLLWATDYPHPDSTWPESRAVIAEQFTGCSKAEVRQLVCDNAARLACL